MRSEGLFLCPASLETGRHVGGRAGPAKATVFPMKTKHLLAISLTLTATASLHADTFGSGTNTFTVGFVNIGNAGNGDDLGAGGGLYSSPYGGVAYDYRMAVTEVPQDWITKATNLGAADLGHGAYTGMQPAVNMDWFQMAGFVNWLNTSTGHHAAATSSALL